MESDFMTLPKRTVKGKNGKFVFYFFLFCTLISAGFK